MEAIDRLKFTDSFLGKTESIESFPRLCSDYGRDLRPDPTARNYDIRSGISRQFLGFFLSTVFRFVDRFRSRSRPVLCTISSQGTVESRPSSGSDSRNREFPCNTQENRRHELR